MTQSNSQVQIRKLPLAKLVIDFDFYPRHKVDPTTVNHFAEAMKSGAVFPVIRACSKTLRIIDGVHRFRSYEKLGIDKVEVQLERLKDDKDFFLKAVEANSRHGEKYTHIDYVRILLRAEELGISKERIATATQRTILSFDRIRVSSTALTTSKKTIPLKRSLGYMRGKTLTPDQLEVNEHAGGLPLITSVNAIINFINADLLDWDNEGLIERLGVLRDLLNRLELAKAS